MMKKTTLSLVLSAALLTMANAGANEFEGGWVGIKAGANKSEGSGTTTIPSANGGTVGLEAGYGWDFQGALLGLNAFFDSNSKETHGPFNGVSSNVYGLDLKFGIPFGSLMPYAKIGYAQVDGNNTGNFFSGGNAHSALGLEYKLAKNWSLAGEYSISAPSDKGTKFRNENLTIGLNYYFDKPAPAPVPVVREEPAPVAEPAPAPEAKWKTVLSEKPVTIDGANFAFDSAKLLPGAETGLNEVLRAAQDYPEITLDVNGHTDSTGKREYNQKLSERRAQAVKEWLVARGVAADRIVATGFADTKPVADNKTKDGRAANRRVDVHYVLREEKKIRVQ